MCGHMETSIHTSYTCWYGGIEHSFCLFILSKRKPLKRENMRIWTYAMYGNKEEQYEKIIETNRTVSSDCITLKL